MRKYGHPMEGLQNNSMGYIWDDWVERGQDAIDSVTAAVVAPITGGAKSILSNAGFTPEEIAALEKEAAGGAQTQIDAERRRLAQQLITQVVGSGGATASTGPGFDISKEIDELNKNPLVASIPGGIYTIAGLAGALIIYMIARK